MWAVSPPPQRHGSEATVLIAAKAGRAVVTGRAVPDRGSASLLGAGWVCASRAADSGLEFWKHHAFVSPVNFSGRCSEYLFWSLDGKYLSSIYAELQLP